MKILIKVILAVVIVTILMIGGAAAILLTFNPNAYKDKITATVKTATGRELAFAGDMKLMFFPVLGFQTNGLTFGNPASFKEKNFINVDQVQAGVKIMPLLQHRIELTTIHLVKPQITIIKAANGHTNLEFGKTGNTNSGGSVQNSGDDAAPLSIKTGSIEISDATVTYINKQSNSTIIIDPLNLKLPGFAVGHDEAVSLDLALKSAGTMLKLTAHGTMKADPEAQTFSIKGLKSDITVTPAGQAETKISLTSDLAIDNKAQKIDISDLQADGSGISLKGDAHIVGFAKPNVMFALSSPGIDVDSLLPAKKTLSDKTQKNLGTAADNQPLLPLETLRTLKLNGTLALASLKASGLSLQNLNIKVSAHDGIVTIDPMTLALYGGALSAQVKIDARTAAPLLSLSGTLKDMQTGNFLKAKMGDDYVTGLSNLTFDLSSRGNTVQALKNASSGKFSFAFSKGSINKWQLSKRINQAIAFFQTGTLPQDASDQLNFTSLNGSFIGQNSVFQNNDLQLIGPKTHVLGNGSINLGAGTVDYTMKAGLGDDPKTFATAKHVPIRITGPLASPNYTIDMKAMAMDLLAGKKDALLGKVLGGSSDGTTGNTNGKALLKGLLGK